MNPSIDTLVAISNGLNTSIDVLLQVETEQSVMKHSSYKDREKEFIVSDNIAK